MMESRKGEKMKKYMLLFLILVTITVIGVPVSQSAEYASSPVTNDSVTVLSRFDLDGISHAVVTNNYADSTAFAIILDSDGFTDPGYAGYGLLFADFYYNILYGCNSGCTDPANWANLGGI
jgi:hypothetical protein